MAEFDPASPRRYLIEQNRLSGFMDEAGEIVVPPQYALLGPLCEGRARVQIEGRQGYLDANGGLILDLVYNRVRDFAEGLAAVQVGRRWGFIDLQGRMVIPPQYSCAWQFTEGLGQVELDSKTRQIAFIEPAGQVAFVSLSRKCGAFSKGLANVSLRNHWGYLDKQGHLALVEKQGRRGYINRDGAYVWRASA